MFDHAFRRLSLPAPFFTDRLLPQGYAPFASPPRSLWAASVGSPGACWWATSVTAAARWSTRVQGRGQLDGRPLVVDGLWGLLPGTQTADGTDAVRFCAGPDDGTHGLVGQIRPAG